MKDNQDRKPILATREHADDVKKDFKALLANREFKKLFYGLAISGLGDWIATLALISLVWNMVENPHYKGLAVGGMIAFRILPALFSGPITAVIGDRWDRRRIMIGCSLAQGVVVLAIPFLEELWLIYLFLFLLESLTILFLAARDSSIPNLVQGSGQLTMANSFSMAATYGCIPFAAVIFSLLLVPSPLTRHFITGGYLVAHPTTFAFIADSITFFVAAWFISRMVLRPSASLEALKEEKSWSIKASLTFALHNHFARSLLLGVAMGCVGGGSLYAVGIGYVRDVLGAGDVAFGFLMALFGMGMIVGVVAMQFLEKTRKKTYIFRLCLLVLGGIMIGMSIVTWLPLAYLLAGFFGAAFGILFLAAVTLVQEEIPDRDRGKAFGAFHAISRIFLILGAGLSAGIWAVVGARQLNLFGWTFNIQGASVALFVAGLILLATSTVPLGKDDRAPAHKLIAKIRNSRQDV